MPSVPRVRVLLVPDTRYWILGRIATAIAGANEWIEATIISRDVLSDLLDRDSSAVGPFDLVHFVVPFMGPRLMGAFRATMPVVTTMHHFDETQPLDLIDRGDAICVVASEWRDWFRARGYADEQLWLMPNGVDTAAFHPWPASTVAATRKRLDIEPGATVIGFVGKPAEAACDRKGSDVFLEAIGLLRQTLPSVTVLVIGPGWGKLAGGLERAGVQCVNLPFVFEHGDLSRLYAAMDLYWVTARIEGGPCTLLEAMSTGTCTVTTPVGMAKDIVRDGVNAALVPPGDPGAVARRSIELLRDSALRLRIGSAGRETMVNGFGWEQTAKGAWELYRRAARNWQQRAGGAGATRAMPPPPNSDGRKIDWSMSHLAGVKPEWRRWVRAMEDLFWLQQLVPLGANRAAQRLARRAILSSPFEPEVWRRVQRAFPNARPLQALGALYRLAKRVVPSSR